MTNGIEQLQLGDHHQLTRVGRREAMERQEGELHQQPSFHFKLIFEFSDQAVVTMSSLERLRSTNWKDLRAVQVSAPLVADQYAALHELTRHPIQWFLATTQRRSTMRTEKTFS